MAYVGFKALSAELAKKGAKDPDALAAWIGRKKYGKAKFAALAGKARRTGAGENSRRFPGEELREVPFDAEPGKDGLTLSGYAAVFDSPATIRDQAGDFEEVISRGAFARTIGERTPVLMFEHGRHPLIGTMPLGRIETLREDRKGLFVEARLSDNWLIEPVRDAVRDGAISGMSFRFSIPDGGDHWEKRSGKPDLRTIRDADVAELGPVVFPAYEPTTASIRARFERLPVVGQADTTDLTGAPGARSAGRGDPRDAGQRGAHPLSDAEVRDRILRMKGIIRA